MFIFKCPHLNGSIEGARCNAAICIVKNNLIKYMENVDIKLCISKKRRFEACYIYHEKLRRIAISKLPIEMTVYEGRSHISDNL